MSLNTSSIPVWRKRTPRNELIVFTAWLLALAFVSWTFQVMTKDTIWAFVTDAPIQMQDIGSRMMPLHGASLMSSGGRFGKRSILRP